MTHVSVHACAKRTGAAARDSLRKLALSGKRRLRSTHAAFTEIVISLFGIRYRDNAASSNMLILLSHLLEFPFSD